MADVAYVAFAESQRAKKCDARHDRDNPFHFNRNRNREKIGAAVGEKNGASDHDAKDGAGRADGGHQRVRLSPNVWNGVHEHVDEAGADTRQKIIAEKSVSAPDEFDFAAEHPEEEHVQDDVPHIGDIVEKKVRERLPDATEREDGGGNQTKPFYEPVVAVDSAIVVDESFQNENGEIGDEEKLHTRSDVKIEADAVALYAGARGHVKFSVRGGNRRSKGRDVVTLRGLIRYVVTEFGVAHPCGKSICERAKWFPRA